jgi:hypothetical protein
MGDISLKIELSQGFINNLIIAELLKKKQDSRLLRVAIKKDRLALSLAIKSIIPMSPWEHIQIGFMVSTLDISDGQANLELKSSFKSLNLLMRLLFPFLKKYFKELEYWVNGDMLHICIQLPKDIPDFSNIVINFEDRALIIDSALNPSIEYLQKLLEKGKNNR